jgi:hypothetical protein
VTSKEYQLTKGMIVYFRASVKVSVVRAAGTSFMAYPLNNLRKK